MQVHQIRQTQEYRDKIRFTFYPPKRGMAEEFIIKLYTRPDPKNPWDTRELVDTKFIEFKDDVTQYVVTFESPQASLKPGTDYVVSAVAKSGEIFSEPVEEMVSTGKFSIYGCDHLYYIFRGLLIIWHLRKDPNIPS